MMSVQSLAPMRKQAGARACEQRAIGEGAREGARGRARALTDARLAEEDIDDVGTGRHNLDHGDHCREDLLSETRHLGDQAAGVQERVDDGVKRLPQARPELGRHELDVERAAQANEHREVGELGAGGALDGEWLARDEGVDHAAHARGEQRLHDADLALGDRLVNRAEGERRCEAREEHEEDGRDDDGEVLREEGVRPVGAVVARAASDVDP
mmetsp:Transcript_9096/g.21241  ORF Transcript_9096/g.21241 Transcript_9096/m.21241 type:complete len:213 (-) Transcript_9096:472-1110(-)